MATRAAGSLENPKSQIPNWIRTYNSQLPAPVFATGNHDFLRGLRPNGAMGQDLGTQGIGARRKILELNRMETLFPVAGKLDLGGREHVVAIGLDTQPAVLSIRLHNDDHLHGRWFGEVASRQPDFHIIFSGSRGATERDE